MLSERQPFLWYLLLLVLVMLRVLWEEGGVIGRARSKAVHYHVMTPITHSHMIQEPPMW